MTDLIQRIETFMKANPYCSRAELMKGVGTSFYTMKKLDKQGVKLPLKQSASIGGSKARQIALKAGRNFTIKAGK